MDIPHPSNIQVPGTEDPQIPVPGTSLEMRAPKVPPTVGRDVGGKVIPHKRDDRIAVQIAQWIGCGATVNEIAIYLNLRPGTLRKYYKHEIATGEFEVNMSVAGSLLRMTQTEPSVAMFWSKARMGWRDKDRADQDNEGFLNIHIHC